MDRRAEDRTGLLAKGGIGLPSYWTLTAAEITRHLESGPTGLSAAEASDRLKRFGRNSLDGGVRHRGIDLLMGQFRSPLVLILVFAAAVSGIAGDFTDAFIIAAIVLGSALLGFSQEYRASVAVDALRSRVSHQATVLRDGELADIAAADIVPGDVIELNAGDLVPADSVLIAAKDFFVVQSALTGEAFPVQKLPGVSGPDAPLSERLNIVFMGTSVRSGTARAIAAVTGPSSEFGMIAGALEREEAETAFSSGIRRFGYLMSELMIAIVVVVLAANIALDRPLLDSLMFSVALAVGLTPQMLPAIISVTLSRGARRMAVEGVIVKRLGSIENIGSMDVLCTDKTGTISIGQVQLGDAVAVDGKSSGETMRKAHLNALFQAGLSNPLDDALLESARQRGLPPANCHKIDEIPYDFIRKRLAVIVENEDRRRTRMMIVKGAFEQVVAICSAVRHNGRSKALDRRTAMRIRARFETWSGEGFRVLAVASRTIPAKAAYTRDDEQDLVLDGFLLFLDPPKPDAKQVLHELKKRGVSTKIITGDNRFVAEHLAREVGLAPKRILRGAEIAALSHDALVHLAPKTDLFAEVDPNQKERIVHALRQAGHVVGYLGDGINDATALKNADIGISVDQAVDVAKEAADMVLMHRDLNVLCRGIDEGRRIFANTMKYISLTTSANFGNMISMAAASLFLPFLPLLAKQILLNNFLSDLPALAIADDNVDSQMIEKPHHWDIGYIRRFMICFGLVSSVFDLITFSVLLHFFHADAATFRTGWFIESLMTELCILLVIRTKLVFFRSQPGPVLVSLVVAVALLAVLMPYLPFAGDLGFTPLPVPLLMGLLAITGLYVIASELSKLLFFAVENRRRQRHKAPRHRLVRR